MRCIIICNVMLAQLWSPSGRSSGLKCPYGIARTLALAANERLVSPGAACPFTLGHELRSNEARVLDLEHWLYVVTDELSLATDSIGDLLDVYHGAMAFCRSDLVEQGGSILVSPGSTNLICGLVTVNAYYV